VRDAYLKLVAADPERWLVVDGALPEEKVRDLIWTRVKQLVS
jgi:thymidylate kinase